MRSWNIGDMRMHNGMRNEKWLDAFDFPISLVNGQRNGRLPQDIPEFIVYLSEMFTWEVAPLIFVRHSINMHNKTQINLRYDILPSTAKYLLAFFYLIAVF